MPPVKKDKPEENEKPIGPDIGSTTVSVNIGQNNPGIYNFEQSLLRLGIDLTTGMHEKTRFPSTQEVAGIDALCKLYGTLKGYHGN